MKRVATVILNRNLPDETDNLCRHIVAHDGEDTEVFVLEAGSDPNRLSAFCTWHVNDPETMRSGLRYGRGMNYALAMLKREGRWSDFDYYFLLTNDTEFDEGRTVRPLVNALHEHPKVGIISPCSRNWGELSLLKNRKLKYFWFVQNNALMFRRECIESIMNDPNEPIDFLFDGNNFRGYLSESELIAKAYLNDWALAITSEVYSEENESYLIESHDKIRTETYNENRDLYLKEGRRWLRRKYGFSSRWTMHEYVKFAYDRFFLNHPELGSLKI